MNWLDSEVKGQGHSDITYGQVSTLRDIFSPISGMHRHICMKLITDQHDTDEIFKVVCLEVKHLDNISENASFLVFKAQLYL